MQSHKIKSRLNLTTYFTMLIMASSTSMSCADTPKNPQSDNKSSEVSSQTTVPSDAEINAAVSAKLFFDRFFDPEAIKVETTAGIVTLTGVVNDLRSKDRAIKISEGIRGVRSIVDRLNVQPTSRPDSEIHHDIVSALATDPTTDAYKVDVEVKNGVADLTGKVQSWSEKNLTAWVAKGISGVKEVKNNIDVEYKTIRPDIEVFQDIMARIKREPWLFQDQIYVNVKQGKVELSGTVGSPSAKRRAQEAAWVAGVMTVNLDNLKVDPALADPMVKKVGLSAAKNDEEIKDAIEASFLWDPRVNYFNPKVSVKEGVATLTGTVDSLIAKQSAEDDAQNTVGVRIVENQLKVDFKKRSNAEVAKEVKKSLKWNLPENQSNQIQVKVDSGVVTLTGKVQNAYQKWQARDAAMRVNGVAVVNNQVKLGATQAAASDEKLKERIQAGIFWDPILDFTNDKVDVSVKNGIATLTGTVDSWDEHWSATQQAFEAGASTVKNSLTVEDAGVAGKTFTYNAFPVLRATTYWMPIH